MKKTAVICLTVCVFSLCLVDSAFAAERKVTLTTYYPAPYGEYKQVKTNNIVVGDTSATAAASDQTIKLEGISTKPDNEADDPGVEGTLYYDGDNHKLLYSNGTEWVGAGGGGKLKIVKNYTGLPNNINSIDCGAGYQIIRLGLGRFSTLANALDEAASMYNGSGVPASAGSVLYNCYGNQSCNVFSFFNGFDYDAYIALCAES